jgi:molybdenum cofactor guanylyltransferase
MYGLILAGGSSSRMQQSKTSLLYNNIPAWQNVLQLLEPHCNSVFLNTNEPNFNTHLSIIKDELQNIGPVAGLLAAHTLQPTATYLVTAIDYPLLQASTITTLVNHFNISKQSIVLYNTISTFYEPYIGIYTATTLASINNIVQQQGAAFSLQKNIKLLGIQALQVQDAAEIKSIDILAEYESIKK